MTFYSDDSVQTMYIDSTTFVANNRVTFDLDGSKLAYLPNMRLINLGLKSDIGNDEYNELVGANGVITNIRLLDGKTEISALNQAGIYRGFLNCNKDNNVVDSVTGVLHRTALGYKTSSYGLQQIGDPLESKVSSLLTRDDEANLGTLDLRECFPILSAISHLPTSLFKNLRVEVVFNNRPESSSLVDPVTAVVVEGIRPTLVVDVLQNPKVVARLNQSLMNANWLEIEHDRFVMPVNGAGGVQAGDNGLVQNINQKINGFNNKRVQRMLIVKQNANQAKFVEAGVLRGFGTFASQNINREKLQVRLNGRNIFPRSGLVGNNERLGNVHDVFGEMLSYPGSNSMGSELSWLAPGTPSVGAQTLPGELIGQLDYDAVLIGDYISDLQINLSRSGLQTVQAGPAYLNFPSNDQLSIHVFGEVQKQIRVSGNEYVISYVQ